MKRQIVSLGEQVTVENVPGVPGTEYAGASGAVVKVTGDLVRVSTMSKNGKPEEIVVVARRLRKNGDV